MDTTSSTPINPSATTPVSGNGAAGTAHKAVERAAQTAHQTVDRVAAAATPAIERLQAKADALGAMEEAWIANARGYVREHPLTALAIGVVAGMIIGRLAGSRS